MRYIYNLQLFHFQEKEMINRITRRGPDYSYSLEKKIGDDPMIESYFYGSVLWMQGPELTPQPIENESGILLFNGDIFDVTWANDKISDTQMLLNMLSEKFVSILHPGN